MSKKKPSMQHEGGAETDRPLTDNDAPIAKD